MENIAGKENDYLGNYPTNHLEQNNYLKALNHKLAKLNIVAARIDPQGDSLSSSSYVITQFKTLTPPDTKLGKLKVFFVGHPIENSFTGYG